MTTKEYLSRAFYLERQIKSKENQLQYLRAHVIYVTPSISDMPNCSATEKSRMEKTLIKILELEDYINKEIIKLIAFKNEIEVVIKAINNVSCETILELRYLEYLNWGDIAIRLNVSQDHVYYLHRKALKLVQNY
jgi:DNA-directed RNA polymerase specialized sigma subunit